MSPLPPGTLLQHRYLRRRLKAVRPGTFVDVGTGEGHVSRLLLDLGWAGEGWDLNADAVASSSRLDSERYVARHGDWLAQPIAPVDLVIASMVLEHLDDRREARFLERCRDSAELTILLVPGSPRHWGIEDDIAGHFRRYTRRSLQNRLESSGLRIEHISGLTYPLSNLLLPLSNKLVLRAERDKTELAIEERTALSGVRDVSMKTRYPKALRVVLNDVALTPFQWAQLAFRNHADALVLYAEARATKPS